MANGNSGFNTALADLAGALSRSASAGDATEALTAEIERLRSSSKVQADAMAQYTAAVAKSGSKQASSGGSSALGTVGETAAKVLGSGFGISSLIGGLVGLFGGGDSEKTTVLNTYTPPESIQFEGDVSRSTGSIDWGGSGGVGSRQAITSGAAQITVQVNAMDSQSFLDHSQEIARAVRQAMLNSNSLNDVVNEL